MSGGVSYGNCSLKLRFNTYQSFSNSPSAQVWSLLFTNSHVMSELVGIIADGKNIDVLVNMLAMVICRTNAQRGLASRWKTLLIDLVHSSLVVSGRHSGWQ